jgi:Tol biopolymer transport system component
MSPLVRWGAALLTSGLVLVAARGAEASFRGQNGSIAFASSRDSNFEIYVMNGDGTNEKRLTADPGTDINPRWSPDGTRIAFMSNRSGSDDIYVMDAQGGGVTRLTTSPASDDNPTWSPDGRNLAFASTRDGNSEIYVMNADGSGQARLTTNPAVDVNPAWSPDGSRIAFASNRDGRYQIYVMNVDGTNQTRLTNDPGDDISPNRSPDGSRIAFASDQDGNYEIYVVNADGTNLTRLTRNTVTDIDPVWSPDGNYIAFTSRRDGDAEIYSMNANGTAQTRLTTNPFEDSTPDWQALPEVTLPPTAVQIASLPPRWRESIYRGALVVQGQVPGPSKLLLSLRRGSRTYLTRTLDLAPGPFQQTFKVGGALLPATYVLDVDPTGSPTTLSAQHVPVTLSPPPEGVVSQAWSSSAILGPPLAHLPPGSSIAWAQFRFAALPKPGRTIVVSWRGPAHTVVRPVRKPRAALVVGWIGQANGPSLPRGRWQAVLTAGKTVVKRLAFRVG